MAGLSGAPGATGPVHRNDLPAGLARQQYAALAAMRWQIFRNSLRTGKGVLELSARVFTYAMFGMVGLGLSVGFGFGSYAMITSGHVKYLPILFWVIFAIWLMLPVLLASMQEQFDLGILLRFPVSFRSYFLLYLIFGIIDVSTITGVLCCLGLGIGTTVARPELGPWMALALVVFVVSNVLLVRAIFAWIDRWLAQRRTREIVGAIFLVFVLCLQLLNPAVYQGRRRGARDFEERAERERQTLSRLRPWLTRADAVQRWLPPGLTAQAAQFAADRQPEPAFDSVSLLGMYALVAGFVLGWRLRSEYAGESLGEAPARRSAKSRRVADRGGWTAGGSGPVGAIVEKEIRAMQRTLPLLYAVGAPLLLVVVFAGVFLRNGSTGHTFTLALPVCLIYAQLGFTQLIYNNLGTEGAGIQVYFLSPTLIRSVLLAKNIFHSVLFALVALLAGVLAVLRLGMPPVPVIAASVAWLLFALPCNLTAGNIFSLIMPYRINPGRLTKQRGSQGNALLSMLVQLAVVGLGAAVFSLCWLFDAQWVATPVLLVLAVAAWVGWRFGLSKADALANAHKEDLIATMVKAE
jgi:ABC-2 type transport system permease protein